MASRSMTIKLTNRVPDSDLAFCNPAADSGPRPTADQAKVSTGQTMTVSAVNRSGGCDGSFSLNDGPAYFGISYHHPSGPGSTTVDVTTASGYLAGANATTFPGHDSLARLNLYKGVAANAGWTVPLGLLADPVVNNCQDFVNSLFAPGLRGASTIAAAYGDPGPDGYVAPADFTGGQMAGFVGLWQQHWLGGQSPACPATDAALLDMLSGYVEKASNVGPLVLWVPQIGYVPDSSPSVYRLTGYRRYDFKVAGAWNADTVGTFLGLLAGGAHFVAVSADADRPDGVTMQGFDQFFKASGLPTSHDIGNSHYASLTNVTGTYYLDIGADFAPENCGLILAFLAGQTVNDSLAPSGAYNTFIQLEGWQAGHSRHNFDYDTYKKTLWNISTFGACPYSEKRATTVFLAPDGWTPQVYQITRMMPYVGAYANRNGTPQDWLNTSLVEIPADAPALPDRYYV